MSENVSHFKIETGSERGFGLVFAAVFLIIFLVPLIVRGAAHYWVLSIAAAFAVIALVAPHILKPLNTLWFRFGMLLGAIIAPLVMMAIFFLVVTPTGLLMRLLGKDPLRLKRTGSEKSYWILRTRDENNPSSMKNQF
jgi:ABC-type uncharacterized transport system permease subunit